MIVTGIILLIFLISLLALARLMRVNWRTVLIFQILSLTIGLAVFSAMFSIMQVGFQVLTNLTPQEEISIAPLIFIFEFLTGMYVASKILQQELIIFLKLTLSALSISAGLSFLLILALV